MEAQADKQQLKWEGRSTAKLQKPTAEAVWPLLEDFCSIHKWLPTIDTCTKVEGQNDVVRYCAATIPPPSGGGEGVVKWCREKLLDVDPTNKCLSYEVLDNNMGIKSYKSTMRVMPIDGGDELMSGGCQIEWSFLADPVDGLSREDLVAYLDINIQGVAKNIEKALESS